MTRALEKHILCKVLTLPCGFVRCNQESLGERTEEKRGDQGNSSGSWNQSSSSLAWKGSLGVGCHSCAWASWDSNGGTCRHSVVHGWGRGHTKHGVVGQHAEVRNYSRIQLKTNSKLTNSWSQLTPNAEVCPSTPAIPNFVSLPTHNPASPTLQVIQVTQRTKSCIEADTNSKTTALRKTQSWDACNQSTFPWQKKEGKEKKDTTLIPPAYFPFCTALKMHNLRRLLRWSFVHPVSSWINWKVRRKQPKQCKFYGEVACVWI